MASRALAVTDLLNPSPDPELPQTPQRRQRSKELSRDEKLKVRGLREFLKLSYGEISKATGYTSRQVQLVVNGPITPKK